MIRLTAIELINFKNVTRGRIVLSPWKEGEPMPKADIVGIYGQNGSGKTSVVQALDVLRRICGRQSVRDGLVECLAKGSERGTILIEGVEFDEKSLHALFRFTYKLTFGENDKTPVILGEELAAKDYNAKESMRTLLSYSLTETSQKYDLYPKTFWKKISSLSDEAKTELIVAQRLALNNSSSLVFSDDFRKVMRSFLKEAESKAVNGTEESQKLCYLICFLLNVRASVGVFALGSLAVVNTAQYAATTLNQLNLATHEGEFGDLAYYTFGLDLDQPAELNETQLNELNETISHMNPVLSALVPGLSLHVASLGRMLNNQGQTVERVEITCSRNNATSIPLRSESEGIKKLASILTLLIDVYSKPGSCVAIDELDSGVFEFLLGEILQVLQIHGRGQLIFTAHNLRPLEVLNSGSLVFTTTNPEHRYIRFKGSREKNNLRNQYLRAINLGGQSETVYEPTNAFDIDSAFYDAGFPEEG